LLPPLSVVSGRPIVTDVELHEIKKGLPGLDGTVAALRIAVSDQGPGPTALIALYLNA